MAHPTDSLPTTPVVQAADGSRWHKAGHADDGMQLYVLEGVDPETTARWVRARENELVELVGELTPVTNQQAGAAR